MARFHIRWTETVDCRAYIDVHDCTTENELRDKINTDTDFNWYPEFDVDYLDTRCAKTPYRIERMED